MSIISQAAVVWFRNDLRIHDNECLKAANNESISVLPVYCFDTRDYGKSSSGYDITGPLRAKFILESVSDLRKNLKERGSDLVVRVGRPESILLEMVKAVGADAVYVHKEVARDDVKMEEKIGEMMKDEGVEMKYFCGSTLYHVEDLPFKLEEMPTNYGRFKGMMKGLTVRKTIEVLDMMKELPKRANVAPGELPLLVDLGLSAPTTVMAQNEKTTAITSLVGGETEVLRKLRVLIAGWKSEPDNGIKNGITDEIDRESLSCKLSPWLAIGCLSPRFLFDELKKSGLIEIDESKTSGLGTDHFQDLLWRDFFRFITWKYSYMNQ